jgi:predicted acetyltransferase
MGIEVRATAPEERRAAANATRVALLDNPPDDETWAKHEARWQSLRSFSAWDGDRCVGHVGSFDTETTAPGGAHLTTIGVTSAGVLPTHVRQGIFRRLIDALIADAIADGVALASLRASEATIYGNFGFGMAGDALTVTIDVARARPLRGATTDGTFDLVPGAEILDTVRPIYDRADRRPGRIARPDWLWGRFFENAVTGHSVENVVVHRSATGEPDGYAHYQLNWSDDIFGADHGTGKVHEVWATSPEVELALWQFLFDIPLVRQLSVDELAADSVLFHAAADFRAVRVGMRWDEQWLRILDVDAALAGRSWADAAPIVVGLVDSGADGASRRWRIGAGAATATDDLADLTTDIAGLSAAYLGSTSWADLTSAGRAEANDDATVRRADAVFAHRPLTFSGSFF